MARAFILMADKHRQINVVAVGILLFKGEKVNPNSNGKFELLEAEIRVRKPEMGVQTSGHLGLKYLKKKNPRRYVDLSKCSA